MIYLKALSKSRSFSSLTAPSDAQVLLSLNPFFMISAPTCFLPCFPAVCVHEHHLRKACIQVPRCSVTPCFLRWSSVSLERCRRPLMIQSCITLPPTKPHTYFTFLNASCSFKHPEYLEYFSPHLLPSVFLLIIQHSGVLIFGSFFRFLRQVFTYSSLFSYSSTVVFITLLF